MEKKENFYHELDKHARNSFCTCQTLMIGLILVALGIAAGGIWVVGKIKTVVTPERKVVANAGDATLLREKVADLAKAPGASTTLVITEQELTGLLVESSANKSPDFLLRGAQAAIDEEGIIISGTAVKYLNANLQARMVPKVVNGQPIFELVSIQAGSFSVPQSLTELLAKQLSSLISSKSIGLENVNVKSLSLEKGKMRVTGSVLPAVPFQY